MRELRRILSDLSTIFVILIVLCELGTVSCVDYPGTGKTCGWRSGTASVIPYKCIFISAGYGYDNDRLLYLGKILLNNDAGPCVTSVHHYGRAGSESWHCIQKDGTVYYGTNAETIQWACSDYGFAWARVANFSRAVLNEINAYPIGWDTNGDPTYACKCDSFYSGDFPPSAGCVTPEYDSCLFADANTNRTFSSKYFNWWHTREVLVALSKN